MTSAAHNLVLSVGALLKDPMDFPATMRFADATMQLRFVRALHQRMLAGLSEPEIAHLYELTLRPLDPASLSLLPEGTLGAELARFLLSYQLRMDAQQAAFPPMEKALADNWVMRRFCRAHDIHHVLLGLGPDVPSELAIQYFNLKNFGEPYAFLAVLATPVILLRHGEALASLRKIGRAWRAAGRASNLFHVPYEDLLDKDVAVLRRELHIEPLAQI